MKYIHNWKIRNKIIHKEALPHKYQTNETKSALQAKNKQDTNIYENNKNNCSNDPGLLY